MHTYELPGSDHKTGYAGLVAVPKRESEKLRGRNTKKAFFSTTTTIYNKLSVVTSTVLQDWLQFM